MSRALRPVRNAARLMCLGAVLTLADAVTVLLTLGGVRSAAVQDVEFTGGRWHIFMLTVIGPALACTPIVAGVWLWLAWATGRGYAWARFAFKVFFGLVTTGWIIGLVVSSGGEDALPYTWADLLATTALWLAGLAALLLVFSQAASPYYQQEPAQQ